MNANINLLIGTDEETLKRKKRIKALNLTAAASLLGIGLISLVIFILIQSVNSSSAKKEQGDILKKVSQAQAKQAKLFVLDNRVENIDKILKTRRDLPKAMNSLLAKIPPELSISDFEINDKSVIIAGQSKSLFTIGEFINNFTDMARKKEIIKSLTVNSLSLDGDRGSYQISVRSEM